MYAESFNELGINKYVIQIKNLKKYKEPIYKLINTCLLYTSRCV